MKSRITRKHAGAFFTFSAVFLITGPVMAGVPVPAPLAGALGPVGLVGAAVVYGCYRAFKFFRNR